MQSNKYKKLTKRAREESWLHRPLDLLEKMQLKELKDSLPNYCEKCESIKNLDIHHKKSRSKFPELIFERSNCVRLCRKCHDIEEQKTPQQKR